MALQPHSLHAAMRVVPRTLTAALDGVPEVEDAGVFGQGEPLASLARLCTRDA